MNENLYEKAEEIVQYYSSQPDKKEQAMIVEMLRELQEVFGCITEEVKAMAAQAAEVEPSFIQLLVRIYPGLRESVYKHEVTICLGQCCSKAGNVETYQNLKKQLRIGKNGVSEDGSICIRTRNCLKNCRKAPNVLIDGNLYSGYSEQDICKKICK